MSALTIWTIFDRPKDHPEFFVVRRFTILAGKSIPDDEAHLAKTLEDAREWIPHGLVRVARHPEDDRSVVESWL